MRYGLNLCMQQLFKTKIIENQTIVIRLMIICGICFLVVMCLAPFEHLRIYIPVILGTLFLWIILFALFKRGDMSSYSMEKDLVLAKNGVQADIIWFPFEEMQGLEFSFGSFNGMLRNPSHKGGPADPVSFGLDNHLTFQYRNQQFNYTFYIGDHHHFEEYKRALQYLVMHGVQLVSKTHRQEIYG